MHIITGLGRSGTSFVAEILQNLGFDMGEYNPHIDAGFEHPQVTAINKGIMNGDYWPVPEQVSLMVEISKTLTVAKDPRWIITLGTWVAAGCKIDSVILCKRDYNEIIKSTEKTSAGTMAMFHGWSNLHRTWIMNNLECGILDICSRNGIRCGNIPFPDSLCNFEVMNPLSNIENCQTKLREAWNKTIREPRC